MPDVMCFVFPLFAAFAVAMIIYGIIRGRRRREALGRLAMQMGLQFYPDDHWDLPSLYGKFDVFRRGSSRKASNVLVGERDGSGLAAFDYRYTTGSGKNRTTHHRHVTAIELPIRAPELKIRNESFLDRMASWVGWDDLDFESDEFSRRYHVKSDDRKFAYDLLHARLIDYLLQAGDVPTIEMEGNLMVLVENGSGSPGEVAGRVGLAKTIVDSIPDYVLKERGLERAGGGANPPMPR